MKQLFTAVFLCLAILLTPGQPVLAAGEVDLYAQAEEQLAQSGIEELIPLIPEGGESVAEDSALRRGDLSGWTLPSTLSWLWEVVWGEISAPFRLLGTLCGLLLLSALIAAFSNGKGQGAFTTASTLCVSAALVSAVVPLIRKVSETIEALTHFMLSFIPVFSGVIAVSGRPASAAAYQTVTFGAAQLFAQLASSLILPLLGIFLALCTVGSVTDGVDVKAVAQGAKSLAMWVLGLCLTVFVALLTLQSLTAGAADTVSTRAVKFVISSAIPVVGGALSEAYGSLSGCLGLVKSAIGVFGVIVMAAVFVPILAQVGMSMLACGIAAAVGELLGENRAAGVIRSVSSALSVLGGLILCYGMMILSSSAILLWMGTPG